VTSIVGPLIFILPNVIASIEVKSLPLAKYGGSGYLALYGGLIIPFGEDQFLGWFFCKTCSSEFTAVLLFLAVSSPPINYLNEISSLVFVYKMQPCYL